MAFKNNMEKYIQLEPVKKTLIWGKESWVIAAHENGDGIIRNGTWKGQTLSWLWQNHREYFGNMAGDRFPLLIKEITADTDLSIQVHPDDAYARKHEHGASGKSECWYILEAKEGASLIMGHNARNRAEAEQFMREGRWNEFLREVPVKAGDFFQIDAGCVHSIKGGIRLLEIQQNSDITYRLYDYDRLGQDGKPRVLHIEKSLDVITHQTTQHFSPYVTDLSCGSRTVFIKTPFYTVEKFDIYHGELHLEHDNPFLCLTVLSGTGYLDTTPLSSGTNLLLSAQKYLLHVNESLKFLLTSPR